MRDKDRPRGVPTIRTPRPGGSGPRITKPVDLLIDGIVNGTVTDIKSAVVHCGLGERGCYKALERPHVRDEIKRRSLERMSAFSLPRAISVMESLLTANSEHVQADMAKHISAIHGVAPQQERARSEGTGVVLNITFGPKPVTLDQSPLPLIESKG